MTNASKYKTKQRDLILDCLKNNQKKHMTADEIVAYFKGAGTPVGKATVYRYLDVLVQNGDVRKYFIEEGMGACYQYAVINEQCHEHFHLKCISCGKLIHVECKFMGQISEHIEKHHKFKVENTKTVLYGLCEDCQTKQKN